MRAGPVLETSRRLISSGASVLAILLITSAAPGTDSADVRTEWRTLGSAKCASETLIVRGAMVIRGRDGADSTYVSFRIEGRDGRLLASDSLSWFEHGLNYGGCDLSCQIVTRGTSCVVVLDAGCWPSYPDVYSEFQYVVLSRDSVARSEWTGVSWNAARGDTAEVCMENECLSFAIPLATHIEGNRVTFFPRRPLHAPESAEFWVPASHAHCFVPNESDTARVVEALSGPKSRSRLRVKLQPGAPIEVRSALVKVKGSTLANLEVEVLRIEVVVAGRPVYFDSRGMGQLGFQEP